MWNIFVFCLFFVCFCFFFIFLSQGGGLLEIQSPLIIDQNRGDAIISALYRVPGELIKFPRPGGSHAHQPKTDPNSLHDDAFDSQRRHFQIRFYFAGAATRCSRRGAPGVAPGVAQEGGGSYSQWGMESSQCFYIMHDVVYSGWSLSLIKANAADFNPPVIPEGFLGDPCSSCFIKETARVGPTLQKLLFP